MRSSIGCRITRRQALRRLGAGAAGAALGPVIAPAAFAQSRRETLVIGIDTSDITDFDPGREPHFTGPLALAAAYETLVTMVPGDYIDVKPALATRWVRTPDGTGWRFTLRDNVRFASGNPLTADDVKFSLDRVRNLKDQPAQYLANVARVEKVDERTVDVILKDPAEPILAILCGPSFSIYDRKTVESNGGAAGPDAKEKDKAIEWFNQNSAGTGPYKLVRWERNGVIQLVANPNYWRGKPPFQRVIIRHMDESGAQLLALRRGDIDAAFNLLPEQIASLKGDKDVRVESLTSLDFVYLGLTSNPEFNKALAVKAARQAVGYAIDYDGIRDALLGGAATRPPTFLPVGINGSTEEFARQTAFRLDPERAKKLLAAAGLPGGFEFELAYGTGAITGTSYQSLAQKLQADLAKVGIQVKLAPMNLANFRTQVVSGKSTAFITGWNPTGIDNRLWAAATVERVAKRVHWSAPDDLVKLIARAAAETNLQKQAELWKEYQRAMVEQANLIPLYQPIYQVGVRSDIAAFPLTAAGWKLDLYGVRRA